MRYYKNHYHEYKELIETVSNELHKNVLMVEKDLIQTMFLNELSKMEKHLIFKGRTSLSKGYKIIQRFSEDIDLSSEHKLTESEKKRTNENILNIASNLDMYLFNKSDIKSRYKYNKYIFVYDSLFAENQQQIIIETNFYIPVYPITKMPIHSIIGDFLNDINVTNLNFIDIPNFEMKVQTIERTFVDKVFAICDYYLQGMSNRYSRHLYDIYKILPVIKFDEELLNLISNVRKDRSKSKNNPSAHQNMDTQDILEKIRSSNFYENDFHNITNKLLYEGISYNECIKNGLDYIIQTNYWKTK